MSGLKKRAMGLILTASIFASFITAYGLLLRLSSGPEDYASMPGNVTETALMQPRKSSDTSLEEALLNRRSVRNYADGALTLDQLSQLLWAAQGLTSPQGLRTAPSAGGLYPLEVYVVVGGVEGLSPGVYRYLPNSHSILRILDGDRRVKLAQASLDQSWVKDAAVDVIIAAAYERITVKYGERGVRYVHLEAGHAAQNVCLQAVALGLGAVPVGAFSDEQVARLLGLTGEEIPLYIIPVGRK
ncbi:MAG: SagB/ThcOx family dehydrogenase [Candidatus Bathyarchaeia archaeon]